jgi:prepilin peptidase CpaA
MTGAVPLTIVLAGKISLVALGLVASWLDVSKRRLPNWLSLLTLAAGLIVTGLSAGFSAVGSHLAHAAVALLVGMVLFRFGVVGGGDAKFYAAIAAWFGWSGAAGLLLSVSLCGIAIFLGWFVWRRATKKPIRTPAKASDGDKLPYGLAIAAGGVIQYFVMAA